jgi:hypothetical protein
MVCAARLGLFLSSLASGFSPRLSTSFVCVEIEAGERYISEARDATPIVWWYL